MPGKCGRRMRARVAEIAFRHTFAAPGLYKVWGQFLDHHGQVITADFVVRVAQ